jgi:Zn-dependent protease with chaperone function
MMVVAIGALIPALFPFASEAGPCDLTWNGDALAHFAQGRSSLLAVQLLDTHEKPFADLPGADVLAVAEAKNGIAKELGRSPRLIFCYSGEPNAFAMSTPSGEVVAVTLGLVAMLNGDRDMAAFVIGHEYAHLVLGHMASADRRRAILGAIGELAGAVLEAKTEAKTHMRGIGMEAGIVGSSLVSYKFDRDQERQADEAGFGYMLKGGFSPLGAIRLAEAMQRYGSSSGGLFFDDHPGWAERTARLQESIAQSPQAQAAVTRLGDRTALISASPPVPVYPMADAKTAYANGVAALNGHDQTAAAAWFRMAADQGYAAARNDLGVLYERGQGGLPKSDIEAAKQYQLSAEEGEPRAQANLGVMYVLGKGGLAKDPAKALKLFQLSAAQGYGPGQFNLGLMYELGEGGAPKDAETAATWYRKAAASGYSVARAKLTDLWARGAIKCPPVPRSCSS